MVVTSHSARSAQQDRLFRDDLRKVLLYISLDENISVYIALYNITVCRGSTDKSSIYTHNGLEHFLLHITNSLVDHRVTAISSQLYTYLTTKI